MIMRGEGDNKENEELKRQWGLLNSEGDIKGGRSL